MLLEPQPRLASTNRLASGHSFSFQPSTAFIPNNTYILLLCTPITLNTTQSNPTSPLSGPLVENNKTQPPPLPKLVAWVIKLAAFEIRYDSRPLVLGREGERLGRGEVGLVVPSRESRLN